MKYIIHLAALVAAVVAGPAAVAVGGDQGDKAKLQGSWELIGISVAGKEIPLSQSRVTFTFQGDKVLVKESDKKEEEGTYTLDVTKTPRQVTLVKGATGKASKGIYDLQGDTLKIATSLKGPEADRPGSIDSKEAVVVTLKRLKK